MSGEAPAARRLTAQAAMSGQSLNEFPPARMAGIASGRARIVA
jgi:hypothetical protein